MSKKSRFKKFLRMQKEIETGQTEEQVAGEQRDSELQRTEEHSKSTVATAGKRTGIIGMLDYLFNKKYKVLMILPVALLLFAIISIGVQYATTGDFINRAVSLKGGTTLTIPVEKAVDLTKLKEVLLKEFPSKDFSVRAITSAGTQVGVMVETDIDATESAEIDKLIAAIGDEIGIELKKENYSLEGTGAALGSSFFKETIIALLVAFVLMGIVVFISFRVLIPSLAVILCVFSDIVVTLAIVNLMGMRVSTAGIAAFLMLIGYSVDTDILLSSRVLKRKEGSVMERAYGAMKTGITMTLTTLAATVIAMLLTESEVIKQIMTILFIGLVVDLIFTWIQNVGILRWYLEKKDKHA